jgi:hypothetical protein
MSEVKIPLQALAALVALALPFGLHAQWPSWPTAGVPRGDDGKVKMDAPAPRTPDGKVDFSGMWQNTFRGGGGRGRGNGAGAAGAGRGAGTVPGSTPAPPPPPPPLKPGEIPSATFGNIGAGFPGGLPLQPWAAELLKKRMADNSKDNPDAHCLPMGLMQFHEHPQPRKMIQTPKELIIIYEANSGLRQIFLDGRTLPKADDVDPWWYGYSVGHWDGDTLVVETTGFRDDVWLDVNGSPLTSSGKIIEKFRRPNFGTLNIEVTIDDPKTYTKPFTVMVNQRYMPDTELIEFICGENEQSDAHLIGGKTGK